MTAEGLGSSRANGASRNIMHYLNEAQQQFLIHQPETGMGYQLVEARSLQR